LKVRPARVSRRFCFTAALALFVILAAFSAQTRKRLPAVPIELNSATVEQLEELPGVGPSTANAIVKFREKSGPFKRPEDLLAIHGISKAKFEKLRPYIVVKPTASATRGSKR
jgi:competence ComEA-like helix-hairpin-helix protein